MKKIRPHYDEDGAPLCSTTCPYYTVECNMGKRVEYCSHFNALDPSEDWCRPMVLRWRRVLERATSVVQAEKANDYHGPHGVWANFERLGTTIGSMESDDSDSER